MNKTPIEELKTKLLNNCANCGAELELVFENCRHPQYKGALELWVDGGYGMFIDPMTPPTHHVLCSYCADKLFELFPFLSE